MIILLRIILFNQGGIQEAVLPHFLRIQLAAYKHRVCFCEIRCIVYECGMQTGFFYLLLISATDRAKIGKCFAVFLIVKGKGKAVFLINKFLGLALRTQKYESNLLVP